MPSFNVLVNKKKKWAVRLEKKVREFLEDAGFRYLKESHVDYTVVVGGDGTLYHYIEQVNGKVLVIGSETSYRAQLTRKNWKEKMLDVMKHKTVELPILEVSKNGKLIGHAINDVVFHTNDHNIVNMYVNVDHNKLHFTGDGLIIATPLGSTAYSYSAGGKILPLGSRSLAITPICPYLKKCGPQVVNKSDAVIKVAASKNASLILDGVARLKSCSGEYTVKVGQNKVRFLKR